MFSQSKQSYPSLILKKQNIFFIEILILYLEVRVLFQMNSYVQVEIGNFYCVDQAKVCFDITEVAVWA